MTCSVFVPGRPGSVWQQGEATPDQAVQYQEILPEQEAKNNPEKTIGRLHPLPVLQLINHTMSAGRISHCMCNWKQITSDPWTLQVVQGYHIEWSRQPFQISPAITSVKSGEGSILVMEEVQSLLQKGAVVRVGTVCEQIVLGGKEGWILPPSGEPATTKLLCEETPLQNGRVRDDQGSAAGRRLDVLTGPKGRIPVSISVQGGQEIPVIYLGQQDVRVHLPSI